MEIITPFDLPPIVMEKVTLDEFLTLLRDRINKHYMPSSTKKVEYNSKPEYLTNLLRILEFPDNNAIVNQGSGYYTQDTWISNDGNKDIYLYLDFITVQVFVNLADVTTRVKISGRAWYPWTTELLAIDRTVLADVIDTYC